MQDLLDLGAGNIVMMGLPPLGCFPLVITLKSNPINGFLERQCVTRISDAAQGFNQIAKQKCKEMERVDSQIYYVSLYESYMDIFQDPKKFGRLIYEQARLKYAGTIYRLNKLVG